MHRNFGEFKRLDTVSAMLVPHTAENRCGMLHELQMPSTTWRKTMWQRDPGEYAIHQRWTANEHACLCQVHFNMAAESLNEEIEYVKLYRIRPVLLHFYLAPFIPIYLIWLYLWAVVYGVTDYFEAGLIALAVVGLLQILSCLFCHWSVHVRCFFTCSTVRIHLDD